MRAGKTLPNGRQRLGRQRLIQLLLILVSAGSLTLVTGCGDRVQDGVLFSPAPTAPWHPMPTRARATVAPTETPTPTLEPTPTPDLRLELLHQALLAGDLAAGERAWSTLQGSALVETQSAQLAGARLALLSQDLEAAELRALTALGLPDTGPIESDPNSRAYTWALLGIALGRKGDYAASEAAFAAARDLDPAIELNLLDDRWRNAVRAEDAEAMAFLAGLYSMHNPGSELEVYYRAAALLANNEPLLALGVLLPGLRAHPNAHALLWYTLGEAYVALGGFQEAAIVLEVAAARVAQGDSSLSVASDAPVVALNRRLARAYLATERCAEAEALYQVLSADHPELVDPLRQAIICQTPTPTPTPWIIRLQSTPSP
jgi:tetratricopeptide (TPR) repeat protein